MGTTRLNSATVPKNLAPEATNTAYSLATAAVTAVHVDPRCFHVQTGSVAIFCRATPCV
jgi:hypothetical protein